MFTVNIISFLHPACKKSAFLENPLDWHLLIKKTESFKLTEIRGKQASDTETRKMYLLWGKIH